MRSSCWRFGRRLHAGLNGAVEHALTLSLPVLEPAGHATAADPLRPSPLVLLGSPMPLLALAGPWAAAATPPSEAPGAGAQRPEPPTLPPGASPGTGDAHEARPLGDGLEGLP